MMEYKGYLAKVSLDDDAEIFSGEVINTRDVITFQGKSVAELTKAFRDSVNDYLAFCKQRNEAPDKPFSGQFVTRIPPELHRQVNVAAAMSGMSINAWVTEQLQNAVQRTIARRASGKKGTARLKKGTARVKTRQKEVTKRA